ncbi:hypothetical protein LCGC14_2701760, partial [marine sediment metagenome]
IFIVPISPEEPKMQHRRYKALAITSTKKPLNTHLWWEHPTYGIIMVDSTNQAVLLHSTIARLLVDPSDWSVIDLSDNTNSYKIQAGWLDGNDLWLVMSNNGGIADDFEVFFIEFDDSNDCNPVGVSAGQDANSVYVFDLFFITGNIYVVNLETRGGGGLGAVWEVSTHPFTQKDEWEFVDENSSLGSGVVPSGDDKYYTSHYNPDVGNRFYIMSYDKSGDLVTISSDFLDGYRNPDDQLKGISYDGNNILTFIAKQVADEKNYICIYDITEDDLSVLTEHNVALMTDRNNSGSVPNEFEKGFGLTNKIVYEIKPKRGGIIQLQNLSSQLSGNIIAITDTLLFAINSGGGWDMFEFTDVSTEISEIEYDYGIIGIPQSGKFITHPDFQANWNKGDSIKIYDQFDILEFWGIIKDKNRDDRGFYVFDIDSFGNEAY